MVDVCHCSTVLCGLFTIDVVDEFSHISQFRVERVGDEVVVVNTEVSNVLPALFRFVLRSKRSGVVIVENGWVSVVTIVLFVHCITGHTSELSSLLTVFPLKIVLNQPIFSKVVSLDCILPLHAEEDGFLLSVGDLDFSEGTSRADIADCGIGHERGEAPSDLSSG